MRVARAGARAPSVAAARRVRGLSTASDSAAAAALAARMRSTSARTFANATANQLPQIQIEALLDHDTEQADGGAAQAEGILGAGGLLTDLEDAGERVELVGDRDSEAGVGFGELVAGAAREVVLTDRDGDFRRLAIGERVVRAHDSLQLRELTHHRSQQVTLAQLSRTLRLRASPTPLAAISPASARTRRVLSPSDPSFTWNVIASSASRRDAKRLLAVLFPEERSIGQSRSNDALVTFAHLGRIAALDVADRDETRQQPALRILHSEITLVILQC